MINRKVVPDGKPSGSCEDLSLICILVDARGMGILGQGSTEIMVFCIYRLISSVYQLAFTLLK